MAIITRKIELWIHEDTPAKCSEVWSFLRNLNYEVFRAANLIVSNQYFNDFYENRLLLQDNNVIDLNKEIRKKFSQIHKAKNDEDKHAHEGELARLKEQQNENRLNAKEFFKTSKQNTTYQVISRSFPEIPSNIVASLNTQIVRTIKSEKKDVASGTRSIRSYRKGIPIPFQFNKKSKPYFENIDGEIFLNWFNDIKFLLRFGKDKSNNKIILNRLLAGEYKPSDSSILLDDKKIFLMLVIDIPDDKKELDSSLSVGVDLGLSVPAYCALSTGYARLAIGNKNDFLRVRIQMQARRHNLQRALKLASGGKGRGKKLKALELLREKERNYVRTYNHRIAKNVIEFADKWKAATVKLELLEGYGRDDNGKLLKGDFVIRNWSYFELQTLIEEKAKRKGIIVLTIDPYHTSQACGICNHYEEGQRISQSEFVCKNPACKQNGEVVNADYNAALNISKSINIANRKEDCYYYKSKLSSLTT